MANIIIEHGPVEIGSSPSKMVIFHMYISNGPGILSCPSYEMVIVHVYC